MQAEVSPEAAPLWNFVLTHARKIAAGVVVVVLVILCVAGWQWYREEQVKDARQTLDASFPSGSGAPRRRPRNLPQGCAFRRARRRRSRTRRLRRADRRLDKAASAYARVAEADGDNPPRLRRPPQLRSGAHAQGRFRRARDEFKKLAASAPADAVPVIRQQEAEAAVAAGDKAGAVSAYEAAVAALPPTDKESAAFFRSRIASLK